MSRKRVYWYLAFVIWLSVAAWLFFTMIQEDGGHPLDAIQLPEDEEEES